MKKQVIIGALLAAAVASAVTGCTDTTRSKFSAYGRPHHITVYQFDNVIYQGTSTGRVQVDDSLISFEDKDTRELVEIHLGQSSTYISKVAGD